MLPFACLALALQNPVLIDASKGTPMRMPSVTKTSLTARRLSPAIIKALAGGADTEEVVSFSPGTGMTVAGRGYMSYIRAMYVDLHGGRFQVKPGLADAPYATIVLKGLKKGAKYLVVMNTYGHGATTEMFLQDTTKPEAMETATDIPEGYGSVPLAFTAASGEYTIVAFMEGKGGVVEPYMHLWSVDVHRVK